MAWIKVAIGLWAVALMVALALIAAWHDPGVKEAKRLVSEVRVAKESQQGVVDGVFGVLEGD